MALSSQRDAKKIQKNPLRCSAFSASLRFSFLVVSVNSWILLSLAHIYFGRFGSDCRWIKSLNDQP